MIWKKTIYDTLTSCSTLCNEFATECSNSDDVETCHRSIFLTLDCADVCRNLAMLYVRGSENTRLLATSCIDVCEKCAQEMLLINSERSQHVYAMCQQTIRNCGNLIDMGSQMEIDTKSQVLTPTSLFLQNRFARNII